MKLEEKLLQYEKHTQINTDEELKKAVIAVIDAEEKLDYEERDYELINEATEALLSLDNIDIDKINEHADKLFCEAVNTFRSPVKSKRSAARIRWIIPIAAALSLVIVCGVMASGFGLSFADLSKKMYTELKYNIVHLFGNEEVVITDKSGIYQSVEAFKSCEKYADISLPAIIDDNYTVNDILVMDYEDHYKIIIKLEKNNLLTEIHIDTQCVGDFPENISKIGAHNVYVSQYDDRYQGEFFFNDCTYLINAPTYEELAELIETLE